MIWNAHSPKLEGSHAFLGASKFHWLNYDDEKLIKTFRSQLAVARGTKLHEYAKQAIELGIKQKQTKNTLNLYINDAIGYKMTPEQLLYYSDNCFGTADSISFRDNFLRIHDLKTGETPTHMEQLKIYAALFCLEYRKKPGDIKMELRIYQNNQVVVHNPEADEILPIMDKIISFDKLLNKIKEEEG